MEQQPRQTRPQSPQLNLLLNKSLTQPMQMRKKFSEPSLTSLLVQRRF